MNVFEINQRLLQRALGDGVRVSYEEWGPAGHLSRACNGHFSPRVSDAGIAEPIIVVGRDPQSLDPTGELITLAHEYGHFCSFRDDRVRWERYETAQFLTEWIIPRFLRSPFVEHISEVDQLQIRQAVYQGLDDESRGLILDEEDRAWKLGQDTLEQLGIVDLQGYSARKLSGLENHRRRLGMGDSWPTYANDGIWVTDDDGQQNQGTLRRRNGQLEIVNPRTGQSVPILDAWPALTLMGNQLP